MKPRVRIDNWYLVREPYQDEIKLGGSVQDHPRFDPGYCIMSSSVLSFSLADRICETHNTIYELGTINPAYRDQFNPVYYRELVAPPDLKDLTLLRNEYVNR